MRWLLNPEPLESVSLWDPSQKISCQYLLPTCVYFLFTGKGNWCRQQTVYRGPDGKQLYTRLHSLCLPPQPCRDSIREATQHENKLVQPCYSETLRIQLSTSYYVDGTQAIICQQQSIHILFSRKCLIQLGFLNVMGRTERISKSDAISIFQSSLNPRHPNIFTALTRQLGTAATNSHTVVISYVCVLPSFPAHRAPFHPNSCKGKSSFAFSPGRFCSGLGITVLRWIQ